ncbi:MAG: formate dehydrogenase accessory sulfurtransferase FdhD [Planctomycetota bacterium]|jgi:FdhD protein|nr:formate dehydrogenase accessory sulfurtransferase FdhD [Planctomycetota bacterium]
MRLPVRRTRPGRSARGLDEIAVEEPLEIRLRWNHQGTQQDQLVTTTMRTPGDDFDLAVGFLVAEGLLGSTESPAGVTHCTEGDVEEPLNVVTVILKDGSDPDLGSLTHTGFGTSACGICGRTRIQDVIDRVPSTASDRHYDPQWLSSLPSRLRVDQGLFESTGGVHAAGAWAHDEEVAIAVREDVGRHNAVDKLVGALSTRNRLPASGLVCAVSGRASFELVQKAAVAGFDALIAVGAPSSLAVETAREAKMILCGFTGDSGLNCYSQSARLGL